MMLKLPSSRRPSTKDCFKSKTLLNPGLGFRPFYKFDGCMKTSGFCCFAIWRDLETDVISPPQSSAERKKYNRTRADTCTSRLKCSRIIRLCPAVFHCFFLMPFLLLSNWISAFKMFLILFGSDFQHADCVMNWSIFVGSWDHVFYFTHVGQKFVYWRGVNVYTNYSYIKLAHQLICTVFQMYANVKKKRAGIRWCRSVHVGVAWSTWMKVS